MSVRVTPPDSERRMSTLYFERLQKARGFALVVSLAPWQGRLRFDLREWYETRPGDPDTLRPTQKGVNVGVNRLPELRAHLERAEEAAIAAGLLTPADYQRAGLPLPDALRPSAA